jgi:hypothetical protein
MCSPQTGEPERQPDRGPVCEDGGARACYWRLHPWMPPTLAFSWVLTPRTLPSRPLQARPALADGEPDAGAFWSGSFGENLPAA